MRKQILIILLITFFPKLTGQVLYDTIPSARSEFESIGVIEEMVISLDIDKELNKNLLSYKNTPLVNENRKVVYISTVFGANGKIKNTRIIRYTE